MLKYFIIAAMQLPSGIDEGREALIYVNSRRAIALHSHARKNDKPYDVKENVK